MGHRVEAFQTPGPLLALSLLCCVFSGKYLPILSLSFLLCEMMMRGFTFKGLLRGLNDKVCKRSARQTCYYNSRFISPGTVRIWCSPPRFDI